jgi:uncharacterized phage infection (PIP) family protein YhgE
MNELLVLIRNDWTVVLVAVALLLVMISFIRGFVLPGFRLKTALTRVCRELERIREETNGAVVELDEIQDRAMSTNGLAHLWREYIKTLHPQSAIDDLGQTRIVCWRSTALAETFFSDHSVIDSGLRAEFYKHLPGILTGIGIIGTFSGLIIGLLDFNVSSNPAEAQKQLGNLVNSVSHAFYISAAAIFLAMVSTWIEKSIVAARYRQAEQLRELIDSLFQGGAGEEYLERLVMASETSATQAAHIKDALVTDLKQILTNLADRQIAAQELNAGRVSGDVGRAIADSLSGPLQTLSKAVESVTANQGDAVNKMLTDVLASFSAQMRDMFGGQMQGMAELLQQTNDSMKDTAAQFAKLASNMESAGTGAVDAMSERLNKAFEAMEARQSVMNTQMGSFVEQIKNLVADSQNQSSQKLQEVLSLLGEQVSSVVDELRKQAVDSSESHSNRQERFEQVTTNVMGSISTQVEQLISQSVETNKSLQNTVERLAASTDKAIAGMNSGADTLYIASTEFAKAGDSVINTLKGSSVVSDKLVQASSQLTSATEATRSVLSDYAKTRDSFANIVSELKVTIENAKRDASLGSAMITKIEGAAKQLAQAQTESENYLQNINKVLVEAHQLFGSNVEASLREGNRQFQSELSTAVSLLSGAIQNLGDLFDVIPKSKK